MRKDSVLEITANVRLTDGLPYGNPNAPYAGQIEHISSACLSGWAFEKEGTKAVAVSVHLGAHEISTTMPTVSRSDVAFQTGASDMVLGYQICLCTRRTLEIIAAELAAARFAPMRLTASIARSSSAELFLLTQQISFENERTPKEWLDFFGFAVDPEILAARTQKYDRLAKIAQPATDDWRTELFLSSMVSKNARPLPHDLVELPNPSALARPFDADFVTKTFKDLFQISIDPAHAPDLLLTSLNTLDLDPHPLFSARWYRKRYDIPKDASPWIDYVSGGWKCGREPNPLFFTPSLDGLEADAYAANAAPLTVYLTSSKWSESPPSPLLRNSLTRSEYIRHMTSDNLAAIISPLFAPAFYTVPESALNNYRNALEHYTAEGEDANIQPCYLFDPDWYRKTYGYAYALVGPLLHFAWRGERYLRDPSPYFSTRYYVENNNDVVLHGAGPLQHYLVRGIIEKFNRRPTSLFDQKWYGVQLGHANSGLDHFLSKREPVTLSPHPAVIVSPRARIEDVWATVFSSEAQDQPLPFGIESAFTLFPDGPEGVAANSLRCGDLATAVWAFEDEVQATDATDAAKLKMNEPIVRAYEFFDEARAMKLTKELLSEDGPTEAPLVSVIMPARNRQSVIRSAIRSVLAQSHDNLELIVVDDGSTDNTAAVTSAISDQRLKVISIAPSGVSAARNVGLKAARGEYVAYLDSDNTWSPFHLQVLLAAMRRRSVTIAHAALRIFNPTTGYIQFRGAPYDRDALDRESYIDMNVFVHARQFIDQGHRFDESLRRCVDWDFIRRMCLDAEGSTYVPIIGCDYLGGGEDLERITISELVGDFYKLSARQIDLSRHVTGTPRRRDPSYTIVWPIHPSDEKSAATEVWRAVQHLRFGTHELIIVNNNLSTKTTAFLAALSRRVAGLRVIHLWRTFMNFPATNLACRIANADRLLFWSAHVRYDGDRIDAFMAATRKSGARLDFPALVTDADRLAGGLFRVVENGSDIQSIMKGQPRDRRVTELVGAASMHFPVAVARDSFAAAGGFDTDFSLRLGLAEFAVRAMREGAPVAVWFDHPMSVAGEPAPVGDETSAAKEADFFRTEVALPTGTAVTAPNAEVRVLAGAFATKVENGRVRWSQTTVPLVSRAGTRGLRIMIMCPAPNDHTMQAWGDYHYAASLAEALRKLGHTPLIRLRDFWSAPSPVVDAAIHLHGIIETRHVKGALNLLWIISHPDKVASDEIRMADIVFVPSEKTREAVHRRFGTDSAIMPQATDSERFAFQDSASLPDLTDRLIFIGNSRKQSRRIVQDAVQSDLPLDIYGGDWTYYVPSDFIRGDYVSNSEVAHYYRSAMCVLNDHWPSMLSHGIISNRLFDVVASGGIAISDEVEGLEATFGGHVRTYRTRAELADLVLGIQDWAPTLSQRREISNDILRLHSFDARAAQFVDFIQAAR